MPAPAAPTSYPSLKGRRVFVTGGGSGIGEAIVEAFAVQGAQVAFIDVAEEASAALAQRLAAAGLPKPWWARCDVRDLDALRRSLAEAAAAVGDFHVLVNNVASDERHAFEDVTPEYWDERMALNQRPAFFAIQSVVPGMQRLGGGAIVNLGSSGWQLKEGAYPCYAIAKSSVNGLTRGLAKPLGAHGIRINTVTPGWVMTERQVKLWLTPEGEAALERNQCLSDRLAPRDIAAMVLFLASDDARLCTAQEFKVDGGWM
ncbi:SDR family oxidoreductase [Aquincola sp. S2]|uniref:SDR family oxidoreductase n=1 Tax=Pseudaquabacterium terrae TaxID=2732868 RepID=A0ABX2ERB3_9BURK|nr:SDR family oxidoreductase [Aquabacterium terrae]NRF71138.1 SDR family oxidoreductase [Aquabacterium terrae]